MTNEKKSHSVVSIFRMCCTLHTICPIFYLLFDTHACRHYGTINLLSALTSEAVKSVLDSQSEEETWGIDSLDILLETWNVILGDVDADKSPISVDGVLAASSLFKIIVESHLKGINLFFSFKCTIRLEGMLYLMLFT